MKFRQLTLDDAISYSATISAQSDLTTKADGMRRGEANANAAWKIRCLAVIRLVALRLPYFTADDIELELAKFPERTKDMRCLGSMIVKASRDGVCTKTEQFIASTHPRNHGCPRRIWKSLKFAQLHSP